MQQMKMDNSPLLLAAAMGHVEIVKALISKGANINITDKNGHTPLCRAAKTNKTEVCRYIVNHIAKLEAAGLHVSQENLQLKDKLIGHVQSDYNIDVASSYKRSFQRYREEVRKLIEEDRPLYDFLVARDVNELIDIWEVNENTFNKLDEKGYSGIKERYSGYADILINKANKVKKEIFLHNHRQLVDVLSAHYKCDMRTMEFTNIKKFFDAHKDEIVVDFAEVEKPLIDFVDFSVKRRSVPRLELQAFAENIKNNSLSGSLDYPNVEQCLTTNCSVVPLGKQ